MANEHDGELVWEAEDLNPEGKPWMKVYKARDYYYYAERVGQNSIAFILYDNDTQKFGLIYESKPPMDETFQEKVMMITAFGGSIDKDKEYIEICTEEVIEEAGYDITEDRIYPCGPTMVSTQMNQLMHGYLIDVTGLKPGKTEADIFNAEQEAKDSDEFKHNKVMWLDDDDMMIMSDWKAIYIYTKSAFANVFGAIEAKHIKD